MVRVPVRGTKRSHPGRIELHAPSTLVFITYFYHDAILNRAALEAIGYGRDTSDPKGGEIERDKDANPTGLLIARSNAQILYSNIAKAPKLSRTDQVNSTIQYMRELNRYGLTSIIDGGGGSQFYPQDYSVISELARNGQLTVRTAYHLFTQSPEHELEDFEMWTKMIKPGDGDDFYRMNGAGEALVHPPPTLRISWSPGQSFPIRWRRSSIVS